MARDFTVRNQEVNPELYVYRQSRDLSKTQVDWDKIAGDLSTEMETIRDERAAARKQIEDDTTAVQKSLNDLPVYENETANTKIQEMAYQESKVLETQWNLVQSGDIKVKDYLRTKQLIKDNLSSFQGAMDSFDEHFQQAQQRITDGKAHFGDIYNNKSLAGFGSLQNLEVVVNPETGAVNLARIQYDENGNKLPIDLTNPENLLTMTHINDVMRYEGNYIDPNSSVQGVVTNLGEIVTAEWASLQGVETLEDWRQLEYVNEAGETVTNESLLNTLVDEVLVTDDQKISMLSVAGYDEDDVTQDPAEAERTGKILQIPNYNGSGMMGYEFTEEHEQAMRETARDIFESQISSKAGLTKGNAPPSRGNSTYVTTGNTGPTVEDRVALGYVEQLNGIVSGNQDVSNRNFDAVKDAYNASNPENQVVNARREMRDGRQQYVITYADQTEQVVDSRNVDGSTKTPEDIEYQLYEKLNYTDYSVPAAYSLYRQFGGQFGTDIGEGASGALETTQFIPAPDFESNVNLSFSYTDKDGVVQYTDETNPLEFLGSLKVVPLRSSDIPLNADNLQRYARSVANEEFLNNVGFENITVTSSGPYVYDITIGNQTTQVSGVMDGKKIGKEINKLIEKETNAVNESRRTGSMTEY